MEQSEGEREKLERESEGKVEVGFVMDNTPDRSRIATPLSKFEESPVFNYINNLSPIDAVKPVRISQTFNTYSFSSLPSVFTSPHVNSLKETRFLRRHIISDLSNQQFSLENGNKTYNNLGVMDVAQSSEEQKESFDPGGCLNETFRETEVKDEVQKNDYCGPDNRKIDTEAKCISNSLVPYCEGGSSSGLVNNRDKEDGGFDWMNITDVADYLIFESPDTAEPLKGSFQKSMDSEMRLQNSRITDAENIVEVEINETENAMIQVGEGHLKDIEATGDVADNSLHNQTTEVPDEIIANESASNLPRGIRRRCLVFEMGGARRKFLDDGSTSSSSILSKCHITTTNDTQPPPSRPENNSSRCIVPGIGLHLNALARTSKEQTVNNVETSSSQAQFVNDPGLNAAFDQSLALISVDRDVGSLDGGVLVTEDAYQVSGYVANDEFNQGSPKKKKRKLENSGETEGCKRCNCKKSKCLKLYCECFAAGVYCVEPCSCQDCFNKPIHEDTVLATRKQIESRNPLAFAPKVIRTSEVVPETGDDSSNTPASARHKRGCNCKKSGCLKKYCECYQSGVGCSINCRCEGCKNAFGRKDGSVIIVAEAEVEEAESQEKSVVDRNLSKNIIQNNTEQNPDFALPATPMHCGRASIQLPFSSKNKPPRSFLSVGSSTTLFGGQKFGITSLLQQQQPPQKLEKREISNQGSEIPEILRGTRSPISGIKSLSPNSKRVSPPHCDFESSSPPAQRATTSRKLILQSIPSFPSLKD